MRETRVRILDREDPLEKEMAIYSSTLAWKIPWMRSKSFQGKPLNIIVIQVYALTSNAVEANIKLFYEDLQDLLELTPKKEVLLIIGDWNAKVGSQKTPGVTGTFGLGIQNESGQRLTEC